MMNFTPTLYVVHVWRAQERAAPIASTVRFDTLSEARSFFRGRFTNTVKVELEAWAFDPKRHEILETRKSGH